MAEPMSPEQSLQGEQLDQKKQEIVQQLKEQNKALGGNVLKLIQRSDGLELMVFTQPTRLENGLSRYGGYCDGAVTIESDTGKKLMSRETQFVEEATRTLKSGGGFVTKVSSDRNFDFWKDSLEQSEKSAADKVKHQRADSHYTPKVLAVIGDMPNVLAAGGFDLHAEMRNAVTKTPVSGDGLDTPELSASDTMPPRLDPAETP